MRDLIGCGIAKSGLDQKADNIPYLKEILTTRNLHPVYPHERAYDLTQYEQFTYSKTPSIVILNTNSIDEFIETIEGVCFINLHQFVKLQSFGSFGLIVYSGDLKPKCQQFVFSVLQNV